MHTTTQIIAKEVFNRLKLILTSIIVFYIFNLELLFVISVFLLLITLFIYRNPERDIIHSEGIFLSPVDGQVVSILEIDNKYTIEIEKTIFDVSFLRMPMKSKLVNSTHINGALLDSRHEYANKLNERIDYKFDNFSINCLVSNYSFKNFIFDAHEDEFKIGERFAIVTDAKIVLVTPENIELDIGIGQHIKAGESIVGYLI